MLKITDPLSYLIKLANGNTVHHTNEPSSSIASQVGTSSDNVQICRLTRPSQPSESDFHLVIIIEYCVFVTARKIKCGI